jgi:hypothetical protein
MFHDDMVVYSLSMICCCCTTFAVAAIAACMSLFVARGSNIRAEIGSRRLWVRGAIKAHTVYVYLLMVLPKKNSCSNSYRENTKTFLGAYHMEAEVSNYRYLLLRG